MNGYRAAPSFDSTVDRLSWRAMATGLVPCECCLLALQLGEAPWSAGSIRHNVWYKSC